MRSDANFIISNHWKFNPNDISTVQRTGREGLNLCVSALSYLTFSQHGMVDEWSAGGGWGGQQRGQELIVVMKIQYLLLLALSCPGEEEKRRWSTCVMEWLLPVWNNIIPPCRLLELRVRLITRTRPFNGMSQIDCIIGFDCRISSHWYG